MKSYIDNVVYLLITTTGDSLLDDFIFKIDAIKFLDNKKTYFSSFINVPKENFIFNSDFIKGDILNNIRLAPKMEDILNDLSDFLSTLPIITFNNKSQIDFLKNNFLKSKINLSNKFLDSFELFILLEPWHFEYLLPELLLDKLLIKKTFDSISIDDFLLLFNSFLEDNNIGDFISHYGNHLSLWNWHNYLINFNIAEEILKDKDILYNLTESDTHRNKTLVLQEDCEELLKIDSGFALLNNKFKFRQAQYDVMKVVRHGLERNLISIIEAPTGTGKSIAYLLPAITRSYYNNQKVFISTNTKELQRQLVHKDLPFLLNSFNLNSKIDIVNIKGKSNYLCINIIQSMLNDTLYNNGKNSLKENMALVYLHRYCYKGKAGDIEEINSDVGKILNLNAILRFCLCDSDGCNIKACPFECYYKNTVEKLKSSKIVILNHSLLLKWPYEINIENVIIDEAHNLSDSIFDAYASTLNSLELKALLLEILDYKNKKGYLNYVWKYTPNRLSNFREIIRDKIEICFISIDRVSYVSSKEKKDSYDLDITFSKDKFHSYGKVIHELLVLKEDLLDLYKSLQQFINKNNLDGKNVRSIGEVLIKKVDRIKELIDFIDIFTTLEQDQTKCYGLFIEKDIKYWECYIKDLNSSIIFFERFLNNLKSCNFLSATLKNNGSYKGFKNSLAIDKADIKFLKEINDVENSFDLRNRSIVYSPTDSPKYFDSNFIDFMVKSTIKILESSSGNILILFTSRKRLDQFKETISSYTSLNKINLFYKKQDIKKLSLDGNRSIILGSKGFFEGIDIPGDLLNIVLMDKMPNISPYDPLFEKFISNGYSFSTINTPRATVLFKQCFGRLIRTEFDYGYFIIFDTCNQNPIVNNISKEYQNVKFINKPLNLLLKDIPLRFKYWNILNFSIIIEVTLDDLELFLLHNSTKIYGNNKNLELSLNNFYKDKFKEFNLNKRFLISTKNRKLTFIYEDGSLANIPNKNLLLKIIQKVFN